MATEMKLITDITLELTGETKRYEVVAKQGDKATRFIRITLKNNGQDFEIPAGMKVIANIQKPDRKCCYNTCSYSGSTVTMELTNQALAVAGTAECDIEIRDANDEVVLSSQAFTIEIEKSMRDENAIRSSNEFTQLEQDVREYAAEYLEKNPVKPTPIDKTLTQENEAADAKKTGDELEKRLIKPTGKGEQGKFISGDNEGNAVWKDLKTELGATYEYAGRNYINYEACIDGYYINASGEEVENENYRVSDKIPVGSNTYFNINNIKWDGNSYVACYGSEDVFLSATKYGQSNGRINGKIPEGTEYIKVGFPKIEGSCPILILCNSEIYPDNVIVYNTSWFKKYIGEGDGTAKIGSEFTSLLRDIPLSALKDANAEYYNLFSNVKDEEIGGYYLPIRSKYYIYATSGGWSNGQFSINVAYKDGTKKGIFNAFHDTTAIKEINTVDIDNVVAVYITTVVSETVLEGIMISTRSDLKEYHPYGEYYFEPSEEMKMIIQKSTQEDIIKKYDSGVLLGIGDSYMQNNTALSAIAEKHGLVCDNRGMASSSISGNEAQTVGLYPFWSRINTAVQEYTAGKTIGDETYHCEDVKLIVFMGGANDGWIDYRRGSGKTDTDTNTIYGALNSCFSTLLSSFLNADIIVILQPVNYNVSSSGWDEEMAKGYGFESLAAAQKFSDYQLGQYAMHTKEAIVKEMAEMYGLNIADCCFNWYSVLNPNDREKYWKADKLHMTSDGNNEIYNVALEKAINNMKITRN